jgi:hypothetical protein
MSCGAQALITIGNSRQSRSPAPKYSVSSDVNSRISLIFLCDLTNESSFPHAQQSDADAQWRAANARTSRNRDAIGAPAAAGKLATL